MKYKVIDEIAVTNGVLVFRCSTPFYATRLSEELNQLQVGHNSQYYWLFVHLLGDLAKLSGTGKRQVRDAVESYKQLANECIELTNKRINQLQSECDDWESKYKALLAESQQPENLPQTEPFDLSDALARALVREELS